MLVLLQEQKNPSFAAQVAAMEARATSLGLPAGKFKYLYPTAAVDANVSAEAAKLGLGDQLVYDEHTGWGGLGGGSLAPKGGTESSEYLAHSSLNDLRSGILPSGEHAGTTSTKSRPGPAPATWSACVQ